MRENTKTNIKTALVITLFIVIGLVAFFKMKDLFRGVNLRVSGIPEGRTSAPLLHISGKAKNATYVAINNRPIYIEPNGNYAESLLLLPGYNIITVQARDKFNNQSEKVYQLTLN